MLSPPKKSEENVDFPLQKSKKIVISRCDLQISGFRRVVASKKNKKIVISHSKKIDFPLQKKQEQENSDLLL